MLALGGYMFSILFFIVIVALVRTAVTKDTYVNSLAWCFFLIAGMIILALNWVGHQLTKEKSDLPVRKDK